MKPAVHRVCFVFQSAAQKAFRRQINSFFLFFASPILSSTTGLGGYRKAHYSWSNQGRTITTNPAGLLCTTWWRLYCSLFTSASWGVFSWTQAWREKGNQHVNSASSARLPFQLLLTHPVTFKVRYSLHCATFPGLRNWVLLARVSLLHLHELRKKSRGSNDGGESKSSWQRKPEKNDSLVTGLETKRAEVQAWNSQSQSQQMHQYWGTERKELRGNPDNPILMNEAPWYMHLIVLWRTQYHSIYSSGGCIIQGGPEICVSLSAGSCVHRGCMVYSTYSPTREKYIQTNAVLYLILTLWISISC